MAHLVLARPTDASRVGNLLGDFAKGTVDSLLEKFPRDVVEGIVMHRAIDRFTDAHPCFLQARDLLGQGRRRYAGVIVDILFDHYLVVHWEKFFDGKVEDFTAECYEVLAKYPEWHVGRLKEFFPAMREHDWLAHYGTLDGIRVTLERVSKRSRFAAPIKGGYEDFMNHYQSFDRIFQQFFPDVQSFADQWVWSSR